MLLIDKITISNIKAVCFPFLINRGCNGLKLVAVLRRGGY